MHIDWTCPNCYLSLKEYKDTYSCTGCTYTLSLSDTIWSDDRDFVPLGFSNENREHLTKLETKHFWFKGRSLLFSKITAKLLKNKKNKNLLELGCGNGSFLPILSQFSSSVTGIDGHSSSLYEARKKSISTTLLHGDVSRIPYKKNSFDFICAFDVLEHIDPLPFLEEIHQKLVPGGQLLLSVPSSQSLWSSVDEIAGHRCRYSLVQLQRELHLSGFKLQGSTHYQFLLFPLLWIVRKFTSNKGRSNSEKNPSPFINKLFDLINKFEIYMFSRISLPIGSSLIVWAESLPSKEIRK